MLEYVHVTQECPRAPAARVAAQSPVCSPPSGLEPAAPAALAAHEAPRGVGRTSPRPSEAAFRCRFPQVQSLSSRTGSQLPILAFQLRRGPPRNCSPCSEWRPQQGGTAWAVCARRGCTRLTPSWTGEWRSWGWSRCHCRRAGSWRNECLPAAFGSVSLHPPTAHTEEKKKVAWDFKIEYMI